MTTQYYTGVIDRFEDELAVILLEDDGDVVDELVLDRDDLPTDAAHEDAILEVTLEDGEVTDLVYDAAETENRKDRAQSRFDRLSERPPSDDDSE